VLKTLLQLPTCCFIHQTYIIGRRMFTIESYSKVEKRCPSRPWCSNDPTRGSSNHDMLSTTTCIPGQSMQEPSNITQAVGYKAQQFLRCNAYLRRSSVITADYVRQAHRRPVTEQISFVESCCSHISSIIELLARNLRAWRHGVLNFPTSLCEHKNELSNIFRLESESLRGLRGQFLSPTLRGLDAKLKMPNAHAVFWATQLISTFT